MSDRDSQSDNEESGRKRRQKSIKFEDDFEREDKDTPPTRSRSRKARSRVAFDDDGLKGFKLEGNLKNRDASKSTGALKLQSRGSSKTRPMSAGVRSGGRSTSSNNRVFRDPGPGIGGQGTDSRREAFEAKLDKYRANKR